MLTQRQLKLKIPPFAMIKLTICSCPASLRAAITFPQSPVYLLSNQSMSSSFCLGTQFEILSLSDSVSLHLLVKQFNNVMSGSIKSRNSFDSMAIPAETQVVFSFIPEVVS
jgi:hypothetical protein